MSSHHTGVQPAVRVSARGLDGAFPALFLALLVPQLVDRTARMAALLGALIALALTPFTPPGTPIVAASAACLLGLRSGRPDVRRRRA